MISFEINKYALNNELTRKVFRGCYPLEKLPNKIFTSSEKSHAFIVNTCTLKTSIEYPNDLANLCHWILIYIDNHRKGRKSLIFYYDSSGEGEKTYPKIYKFLKKQKAKIIANRIQHQSFSSSECGRFCLVKLYTLCNHIKEHTFNEIYYKKDLKKNDFITRKMFKNMYIRKNEKTADKK